MASASCRWSISQEVIVTRPTLRSLHGSRRGESAGRIFRAHWINGVGPRGFREVHAEYAPAHDPYVQTGRSLTHPHMFVLEIAAETGIVGLIGYLITFAVLIRRFLEMSRAQVAVGFPYLLGYPRSPVSVCYAHGVLRTLHGGACVVDDRNFGRRSRHDDPVRAGKRMMS